MERCDVFVIGAGGCGSDVTYALAGAGLSVVMAERDRLGGECSNVGCDPTKAMLKSARVAALARRAAEFGVRVGGPVEVDFEAVMRRVRRLIDEETSGGASIYEARGARVVMQEAKLCGPDRVELADGTVFQADRIVLTTGSEPTAPPIPGLGVGGWWTNREAIWHGEGVPGSLAVLGAGAIGVELAQVYGRFGSKVTVVEASDRVLPPEDRDASMVVGTTLQADGLHIHVGAKVTRVDRPESSVDGRWRLWFRHDEPLAFDRLLVATGRRPCFDGHDLEAAEVELDERGRPQLGPTLRTTNDRVWVGGDATGELLFTHVGGYEAEVIVADILGRPFPREYRVVPRVTYCEPEVASVGLTEDQAREGGHDVVTARARFADNPRSFLEGESQGLVKLVADRSNGELLGGHVVSEAAGELIHEVVAVMAGRIPASVVGRAIHAYPTRSEAIREAFRTLAAALPK